MVLNVVPTAFILVCALVQASGQPVIRIGDVARQLSDQDIAEIERVASTGGRKPWLLNGPRGQIADLRSVEVYLAPDKSTPELRRGAVIDLVTGSVGALAASGIRPAGGATANSWTAMRTEAYCQVAIPGRGYNQVEADGDINRPFRIVGQFDDAELVGLVRFVRSSPPGPVGASRSTRRAVHGDWPVTAVVRQQDSIQVRIRSDDFSSELVTLRRQESGWLVTKIETVFR